MSKTLTVSDGTNEFAQMLVTETLKLIEGKYPESKKSKNAMIVFIARFIGTVVYKSLIEKHPEGLKTSEDKLKFTTRSFSDTKQRVQEAVAAAFSGAMNTYTQKESVEYYCRVSPIGPAVNKEPI